jgi:N-acetylglucosamine-6-phosphate deacetylase
VTHLFNAMGGAHHRDLGVAGVALTDDQLTCDIICDGVHVHPAFVRLAARAKGRRLLLITDRLEPPASADSADSFGAGAVHEADGALRLPDGTVAGSCLTLDRAIANAVSFGSMTRVEAVAAATLRPARVLGIEAQRGTFRPGARADFAVLGRSGEVLETWLAGRRVHATPRS